MSDISTTTTLYVYRDTSALVVYVGITGRGVKRSIQHSESSPWWPYVATASFEHYPDLPSALAAEAEAIRRFRPPFNVIHNMDWQHQREAYFLWRTAADRMVCESDGTTFTFDLTEEDDSHLVWDLTNAAWKSPHRIKVGESFADKASVAGQVVTLIPRHPQTAGRYRLFKHFDPVRKSRTWVVDPL